MSCNGFRKWGSWIAFSKKKLFCAPWLFFQILVPHNHASFMNDFNFVNYLFIFRLPMKLPYFVAVIMFSLFLKYWNSFINESMDFFLKLIDFDQMNETHSKEVRSICICKSTYLSKVIFSLDISGRWNSRDDRKDTK